MILFFSPTFNILLLCVDIVLSCGPSLGNVNFVTDYESMAKQAKLINFFSEFID